MEEDASSMVSNAKFINMNAETSDSYNSNYAVRASKRMRHHHHRRGDGHDDINTSVMAVKFKGVVPQQNGRWGAQIYANHQRIWLGTFKSEKEAAMAYDRAAIKIRSGDSHRNFPWTDHNNLEPVFQNHYTTEAVLNMIRDGSYQPKFEDFVRVQSERQELDDGGISRCLNNQIMVHGEEEFTCRQLFQKELTPSDVGKLNRLVIPKKYAVKYLPYIPESSSSSSSPEINNGGTGGGVDDMELVFYDKVMRTWKFRYCYWKSSQSFVFTRGWNRFVKENKLKEKDIITFYGCSAKDQDQDHQEEPRSFYLIDVMHNSNSNICKVDNDENLDIMRYRQDHLRHHHHHHHHQHLHRHKQQHEVAVQTNSTQPQQHKPGFRLFGVHIN